MGRISASELAQMQGLPLHLKIIKTVARISEFYDTYEGNVYFSFSGGWNSTVGRDIVLKTGLDIPIVFCNTHNEHPEIISFVKSLKNITWVHPKHGIKWVYDRHGYPVVSKSVSMSISRYRTAKDDIQRNLRLNGGICPTTGRKQTMGVIPKKYHYLIEAPFKISDKCCDVLKKNPLKTYSKKTGRFPITGEMAEESMNRKIIYLKHGCNYFGDIPKSTPFGFWTRQDMMAYLLIFRVPYSKAYGEILYNHAKDELYNTGEERTGCFLCPFGCNNEKSPNRFERIREKYPKHHNLIRTTGMDKALDYMKLPY